MQANGVTLATFLAAENWRSPAFLKHLDEHQLEDDAVVEAHLSNSNADETQQAAMSASSLSLVVLVGRVTRGSNVDNVAIVCSVS